jgi:hypothetical protein
MANLTALDIVTTVRNLANEPSSQGRFADLEIYNYINMATIQVMVRTEWPEATYSWTSDGINIGPNTELNLPEIYALLRVYVAGQPCVPSSIPILEGDAIQNPDMSGTAYQPRWVQAPFTGYPVASQIGGPASASLPYFQGQRPSYYMRGGALGIAPPPRAGYTVSFDCYPAPSILAAPSDITFFPQLFKEAIAARTMAYMYFADNTDGGNSRSSQSMQQYDDQIKNVLLPWKMQFMRNLPNKPMPVPHRTFFQGPQKRPTGSASRFGR